MTVNVQIKNIGPDQASALLAGNISNRDLSQSFVNKYAADMSSGKWAGSASMIRIDTEGNLQDGQHRLEAVKQSGTTQEFIVAENCPVDDFRKLDLGRGRSARDALTVLGYKRPKIMASGIRLVCLYNNGQLTDSVVNRVSVGITDSGSPPICNRLSKSETIEQAIRYAAQHPMVSPLTERAANIQKSFRIIPSTVFAAFLFKANELGDLTLEFATEFLNEFVNCSGKPGTASHSLYQRLVQQGQSGHRFTPANRLAMIMVAWNAWVKGKPRVQITLRGGVPVMEKADA